MKVFSIHTAAPRLGKQARTGFTLIELLVVIAIIAILAALLLPTLGRAKEKGQRIACLNNIRQLTIAWTMYADDYDGNLVPNNWVYYTTATQFTNGVSWAPGVTRWDSDPELIKTGLLWKYNQSIGIYRCPSDKSTVETVSGEKLPQPRTRSYNMNGHINCDSNDLPYSDQPNLRKFSDIRAPSPSGQFVFIEPHQDTVLDAHFGMFPLNSGINWWVDVPADRHNQGGVLSFADGHSEHWRWASPKLHKRPGVPVSNAADLADLRRLQGASPAEKR